MSKLEKIRQILKGMPGVNWTEQAAKREHLRREGEFYRVVGLQVAPAAPILEAKALRDFSERITQALVPVGVANLSRCYEYSESRRDVVKTAALYFTEIIEEPGDDEGLERRITVTVYPCRVMAENMGVRGTIELGHYECPEPCAQAKKCSFKTRGEGFLYQFTRR
ncbi:MAG: hypothetical protein R6U37_06605 [Dehalococcoidia bacterium]